MPRMKQQRTEPDPNDVFAAWLATLTNDKTHYGYEHDVGSWLAFIADHVWHAEPLHVETWASGEGGAARSRVRRIAAVRSFYEYCLAQREQQPELRVVRRNPALRALRGSVNGLPHRMVLEAKQDRDALISAADRYTAGRYPLRDRLLVYLLMWNLRPGQAAGLIVDRHYFVREQQRITLKVPLKGGGWSDPEPVPAMVAVAIDDYLPHRVTVAPYSTEETGPLLTSRAGKRIDADHTAVSIVRKIAATHPLLRDRVEEITADGIAQSPPHWE